MSEQFAVENGDPFPPVLLRVLGEPAHLDLEIGTRRWPKSDEFGRRQDIRPMLQARLVGAFAERLGEDPSGSSYLIPFDVLANAGDVGDGGFGLRDSSRCGHFVRLP